MDDNLARRRRVSAAAEPGANVSLQHGELDLIDVALYQGRETKPGPGRVGAATGRMERRNSATHGSHQRHMPMAPLKMTIPRKTKEKRALVQHVAIESREYEDMMTILTSSYLDTSSASCFTYCEPRLIHSELLEKEFVEKRREMKSDGRTEKELEESYCFLLTDSAKVSCLCEKGLFVGQSRITVLGNPNKGVYLSRYSDLLQANPVTPGTTGEIFIFKVMKGKVKSMYENIKSLQDPTPRFDSHISKNASKVTSVNSYHAFELTQQYFYEYAFDELRQRPRQVCPYAVLTFQFKGKDSALPSKPLAPVRLNSQLADGRKERTQLTVWTGDLVKDDKVLFQISLRSFSPPFLPHKLPEKLEIGWLMRFDQVTKKLPPDVFSYNLYSSSQEVLINGHYCSLLEVTDRSRSTTSVTRLLQELEIRRVVLVNPLTERGFLFLLSSVQMATPTERGESWRRSLQALFVFPESRDVNKSTLRCPSSSNNTSESLMKVMPRLNQFIPALHHALVKTRANPPPELSAGVEHQAREYLIGLNDGKVRQYPMGKYDSKLDEQGKLFPPPKHHRVNMDGYLNSYLYSPPLYLLSVARASAMVEAHCGPEEPQDPRLAKSFGGQREATGKEATSKARDGHTNTQRFQQLIDLVHTCKRNAENEVNKEEGRGGGVGVAQGRKRRLEQEMAVRAIKYLKASQEPGRHIKIPVDGNQVPASPGSLTSLITSMGLKDVDLREDGSELAGRLLSMLTDLNQTARGTSKQSLCEVHEERQKESSPFDKLAAKLGLPTNCDIDLRKQDELEEQTAGSVSSLEGFSPGSHSGETNHHVSAGRGGGGGGDSGRGGGGGQMRRTERYEEEEEEQWEIPWVLIPITGLCSERYTQRDRNIPQDPRFQHLTMATSITTTTKPSRKSPTPSPKPSPPPSPYLCPSPEPSPPASPSQCPSPEPSPPASPSQCPSPDPSPPPSPSQCPSPEPSPPASPSQCPSPEPSPPLSPSQCPSPQPSPPTSPSQCPSPQLSNPPTPSRCQSPEPNELSQFNKDHNGANEEQIAPAASREITGVSQASKEKPQGIEENEVPSISASIRPCGLPASEIRTQPSTPPTEGERKGAVGKVEKVQTEPLRQEKETQPEEEVQRREEEKDHEGNQGEVVEEVEMMVISSDEEQKEEAKKLAGSLLCSVSSPHPPCPLRNIDTIVDKHLDDFSSEMQLVLQEESVHYSCSQSPHSSSNTDAAALQHTHPPISQFSQYVSFYNPCPPVQDYVSSLQDSISSMLPELEVSWLSHKTATSRTNTDVALASSISAFVSSIRAANVKTEGDDGDVDDLCGEVTAADGVSVSQTHALSREGDVWQQRSVTSQFTGATHPSSHATLSVSTSGAAYKPTNNAVLHSADDMSQESHWNQQQVHTLEISRTVVQNSRQTQEDSITRALHFTSGAEGVVSGAVEVALPGFGGVSQPSKEASHSSEPVSSPASVSVTIPGSGPAAPAADLNSLISQLKPEVFDNLQEIFKVRNKDINQSKDVKRNSHHFYLHSTEPDDQVNEDIKEHLTKQGNIELSPVAFLNQESSDSKLLVIIKNEDIAGHIDKIPALVSLKRLPSVVFVGIDTLDDIRNNSYNELFVSGGCIISAESVLSPDFMTHDQLKSLLMALEQHSSPGSVWRWKIHCKTHKKLKEQSRFRRDAANMLDMLSAYQKHHIVEFLPYHHCDTMNHQSPDLDCLLEHQARYTQYRHTVLLTESHCENFHAYVSRGIIVASIEEILHDFTRLVGYHDVKKNQPVMDDMLAPTGLGRQLSHSDSMSEHSPSIFPEHMHSLSSRDQPQHPLHQSGSGLPLLSHLSDQLVPDASCKEGVTYHSGKDLEDLRMAISQLRAARQAQLQQQQQRLDSQAELSVSPLNSFLPNPVHTGRGHTTPPSRPGGASESVKHTSGKKAVAATLEFIHSALQTEMEEEDRMEARVQGLRSSASPGGGESRDQRDGTPGRAAGSLGGNLGGFYSDTPAPRINLNPAAVTSNQTDSYRDGRENADAAASISTTTCPVEGDRSRDSHLVKEQPIRGEGAQPGSISVETASSIKVTDQRDNPNPAALRLPPPQQHLQQQLHQQQLHQQRAAGLLQPHHLPHLRNQPYSHGPMLAPMSSLGGGLLGPTPVWPMGPARTTALVWGFQPAGTDFTGSRLLGGYHNSAGPSSNMYRGGQRGGGFNGM